MARDAAALAGGVPDPLDGVRGETVHGEPVESYRGPPDPPAMRLPAPGTIELTQATGLGRP